MNALDVVLGLSAEDYAKICGWMAVHHPRAILDAIAEMHLAEP